MITLLDMPAEQAMLEIYTLDGLIVEIGHGTMSSWLKEIDEMIKQCKVSPPTINSIGGFLEARPLAGKARYFANRKAIPQYPRALAKKVVEQNLGFFWKGCLENQGLKRGELLFVYDAISFTLKRLINILSAMNGLYFWAGEPRWIEYRSRKMKFCPPALWPRIRRMYQSPPDEALKELDRLIGEVLSLVRRQMPEVDMAKVTKFEGLRVQATTKRPRLLPIN
jgi:hypothetical protein